MNKAIIKNWNNLVQQDDEVYLLGDIMLNDNEEGLRCLKQLNGKIHIAYGNHCTSSRIELYKQCHNVIEIEMGYRLKKGKWSFLLTHYPTIVLNGDKPFEKNLANLCGHSHTSDKWFHVQYGCYHVELDAHENKPILLDDIIKDLKEYKEKNYNG